MSDETCSTCRYWREFDARHTETKWRIGDCRRHPPRFSDGALLRYEGLEEEEFGAKQAWFATRFPVTPDDDWCGEFDEREARA